MQTTYVDTNKIPTDSNITASVPAAMPEEKIAERPKPFEGQKIILLDGPVIRCLAHGCNIDTNARYWHKGEWVPACMRDHIASRAARVRRKAA